MIDEQEEALEREPFSPSATFHGLRLSSRIIPAQRAVSGGDWCEAFEVSDHVIALSIGDVSGHEEEKSAAMVAVRRVIREAAKAGLDPVETLGEANGFLRGFDADENATALFGLLNIRTLEFRFANAGHPPPLVISRRGGSFLEYPNNDVPLGVFAVFAPALRATTIPAATLLVFYTDGVIQRDRNPLRGMLDLRGAAHRALKFPKATAAGAIVQAMSLADAHHDDVAILTAWTPPPPTAQIFAS